MSSSLSPPLGVYTGLSNRQLEAARDCQECLRSYLHLVEKLNELLQNQTIEKIKSLQNSSDIGLIKTHHPFDLKSVFAYTDLQQEHLWEVWNCDKSCKCKQTWLELKNALEAYVYRHETANPPEASTRTIDYLSKKILDSEFLHSVKYDLL